MTRLGVGGHATGPSSQLPETKHFLGALSFLIRPQGQL